jgi:hemerythrin
MTNSSLVWTDALLLGFGPMDLTHQDFVDCVSCLRNADASDASRQMNRMLEHLTTHFDEEQRWMLESDFPSSGCHVDEHEAVLRSARQVHARVQAGDVFEAHRFADALAGWFEGHAHYMDAALSHWMSKRAYGGAPVVLRRKVITGVAPTKTSRAELLNEW